MDVDRAWLFLASVHKFLRPILSQMLQCLLGIERTLPVLQLASSRRYLTTCSVGQFGRFLLVCQTHHPVGPEPGRRCWSSVVSRLLGTCPCFTLLWCCHEGLYWLTLIGILLILVLAMIPIHLILLWACLVAVLSRVRAPCNEMPWIVAIKATSV